MKTEKYYNVLFPVWMLIWFPNPLWSILIPVNYLIDRFVLKCSLPKETDRDAFCKKYSTRICLAGFAADLIGSALLFAAMLLWEDDSYGIANGLNMNPFKNVPTFLIVAFAIAISAVAIYVIDHWILVKAGLDKEQAKHSALYLAIFTAPYLFLFPSQLLYRY